MDILTFDDFVNLPTSKVKSYILGLILPKIVIAKTNKNNNYYLIGQINHSHQSKPSKNDIMTHYIDFNKFLNMENSNLELFFSKELKILSKKTLKFTHIRGIGFAVCLSIENSKILNSDISNINLNIYKEIRKILINETIKIKKIYAPYFIAATIDGRSSVDTTLKCISLDIDNDNTLNKTLRYIAVELSNMDINLNDRTGRNDDSRMNQLRYKEDSIKTFYEKYNNIIFSKFRKNRIKNQIL